MLRFRALFEYIESGAKKMGFSYSKNMIKFESVLLENYFKLINLLFGLHLP